MALQIPMHLGASKPGVSPGVPAFAWTFSFPSTNQGPVQLEPNQQRVIAPGHYGDVSLKNGSMLTLSMGKYTFTKLEMETGSKLAIDESMGQVEIYVKSSLVIRGKVVNPSGGATVRPAFFYFGTVAVPVETSFTGAVVVPNATPPLGGQGYAFSGRFVARSLWMQPDCRLQYSE